jgi:hypothetical protein
LLIPKGVTNYFRFWLLTRSFPQVFPQGVESAGGDQITLRDGMSARWAKKIARLACMCTDPPVDDPDYSSRIADTDCTPAARRTGHDRCYQRSQRPPTAQKREQSGARIGSWHPRSPKARDRGHPRCGLDKTEGSGPPASQRPPTAQKREQSGARIGSWHPRSPKARDRGHPRCGLERAEGSGPPATSAIMRSSSTRPEWAKLDLLYKCRSYGVPTANTVPAPANVTR